MRRVGHCQSIQVTVVFFFVRVSLSTSRSKGRGLERGDSALVSYPQNSLSNQRSY